METNQILRADLLDILFEGRNKSYGAYQLRKSYNRRLKTALSIMIAGCLLLFLASVLAKNKTYNQLLPVIGPEVTLIKEPVEPPVPPPPLPPPPPLVHKIARIKFTTPVLTNKIIETPPPMEKDVDKIAIGTFDNNTGDKTDMIAPPVEAHDIGKVADPVANNFKGEVFWVQQQARFPGGAEAWKKFLEKNLRSEVPADNGATTGTYSIGVSFLVDRDGNISEVKALNDPGFGTAAEAIRVVQRGPKWIPAMQNGRNVIYRQKQIITFKVESE